METNTTVAAPAPQFQLPANTADLTGLQIGWLQMAHNKVVVFANLQADELKIQALVAEAIAIVDTKQYQLMKDKQNEANTVFATSKQQRLYFTNTINDKVIKPAMEFEKRSEDLLVTLASHDLKMRQAIEQENKVWQSKENEKTRLRAHATNENFRIATEYRGMLKSRINWYYTGLLKREQISRADVDAHIRDIQVELSQIELPLPVKFELKEVSREEAIAIYTEIRPYDPKEDLLRAQTEAVTAFAMYEEDMKNAAAAIEQHNKQLEQENNEAAVSLQAETAINNIVAEAGAVIVGQPVKIKRKMEIVDVNSQQWALTIMATFIKNLPSLIQYVKVTSWSKLTIAQMAKALSQLSTDTGEQFDGFEYKEIVK